MLKTIIIDDEQRGRNVLGHMLERFCPEVYVVAAAESADEGKRLIDMHNPDLVFLDIEMPQKNGFQLLDELSNRNFSVVFVTAYDRHAMKAINYSALGYLLKPVDVIELKAAVHRAAAIHGKSTPMEN